MSGAVPVVVDPSAVPDPPGDDAGPVERFLSDIEKHYAFDDAYLVSVQLGNGSWANFTVPVAPSPRLWSDNTMLADHGGHRPCARRIDLGAAPPDRSLCAARQRGGAARPRHQRRIAARKGAARGARRRPCLQPHAGAAAPLHRRPRPACRRHFARPQDAGHPAEAEGRVRRGRRSARPHARRSRRHRGDDPLGARLRQRHRPARGARADRPDLAHRIAVQPTCRT